MSPETKSKDVVLLLDVDRTLIDTDRLKELFLEAIQELLNSKIKNNKLSAEKILNEYEKTLGKTDPNESVTKFHPKDFLIFVAEKTKLKIDDFTESFYNPEIYKKVVFPEVLEFLEEMKKKYPHVVLGLFSEGLWQKRKLTRAGIKGVFKRNKYNLIFEDKLSEKSDKKLAKLPEGTMIVDDRLDVLQKIRDKYEHLILIHIDRRGGSTELSDNENIITIRDLRELTNPQEQP